MLLTRIGLESKMVLTGDIAQSDLQRHHQGGFLSLNQTLQGVAGLGFSRLEAVDIVRNPIIASIIHRLDQYEQDA
jgi:phosphate starvation-inducible PhoH-like protein